MGEGQPAPVAAGEVALAEREWGSRAVVTLRLPMRAVAQRRHNYELHPTSEWRLALELDPADPERSLRLVQRAVGAAPFSPEGAPIELHGLARRVLNWGPPAAPALAGEAARPVALVPYGCTNLRMTELPLAGVPAWLHAAEGAEAAVDRHDHAVDERGAWAAQPDQRAG